MRSKVSFLLLFFLLILPSSAHAQNLLKNPSFEQVEDSAPVDWTAKHSTTFFGATTSAAKQGRMSAVVSKKDSKTGWTYAFQDVSATPSAVYKLSGWVRWLAGAVSKAALKIDWLGLDGERVSSKSSADEIVLDSESNNFQYLELVKESPEETATARLEMFVNLNQGEMEPSVFFDQLFFGVFSGEPADNSPQIKFELPEEVRAGEKFNLHVAVSNYYPSQKYGVKFLAGDGENFYEGRTQGKDDRFLAWNASWSELPTVGTDSAGSGSTDLTAMIDADAGQGEYLAKVRLRDESGTNYDSDERTLKVLAPLLDEELAQEGLSLMTISEVRNLPLGSSVYLRGFVTAHPGVFADNQVYVIDHTGGILLKGALVDSFAVGLGDELEVACTVEEAWDERYIKVGRGDHLAVIAINLPEPDPKKISTGDVGEDREGQLVMVTGTIVETSGSTFYIDDGSGRAKIYIKKFTGIDVPDKKVGDLASVTGVVSQWGFLEDGSANYRVMPRYQADLQLASLEEERGSVLGARQLPVTGNSAQDSKFYLDISLALICLGVGLQYLTVLGNALANHGPN